MPASSDPTDTDTERGAPSAARSSSSRPIALITGASAGIGAAFAARLARDGYDLVLAARRRDRLEQLAARLGAEHGARAEVLVADLTVPEGIDTVERRLASARPPVALLINNAGFGGYAPFAELEVPVAEALIDVHVRAVTRLTRAALPPMIVAGAGAVINVASLLALSGTLPPGQLPMRAVYGGAKAYMLAFTQLLAGELGSTNVHVQVCLPGLVKTEFHDVQGMDTSRLPPRMSPDDVVTASLAGLARGEVVCVPGLDDPSLLDKVGEAQRAVMAAGNRPALSQRYR
jgi:short-subunit dehydrogenase